MVVGVDVVEEVVTICVVGTVSVLKPSVVVGATVVVDTSLTVVVGAAVVLGASVTVVLGASVTVVLVASVTVVLGASVTVVLGASVTVVLGASVVPLPTSVVVCGAVVVSVDVAGKVGITEVVPV